MIWLLVAGRALAEVAEVMGYSTRAGSARSCGATTSKARTAWATGGTAGNRGGEPLLDGAGRAALTAALDEAPPVEWFLGNRVNTALVAALVAAVLARFAAAVGAGKGKKAVLLVLDRAGGPASERLAVPEGVRLVFQPPYSPELQPAERLWPLARAAVANQSFARLADLDRALAARCVALAARCVMLAEQPETVKAHTRFHWWPEAASVNRLCGFGIRDRVLHRSSCAPRHP